MEEQLISFETAKLAKIKGYQEWTRDSYTPYKSHAYLCIGHSSINRSKYIAAPTQSLLQKWLREKHNIHTAILACEVPASEVKYYIFKGKLKHEWSDLFDTYEEALEKDLYEGLKLIK